MIIHFSEEFHKYTNSLERIEVEGRDVAECLTRTFNRFPQLMLFLSAKNQAEAAKTSIKLNGEFIFEPEDLWVEVGELDELEFGRDIPEGESAGARMIVGAALIITAVALATMGQAPAGWTAFNTGLAMFGGSLALGGLAEVIAGRPSLPGDPGTSPTYSSFSGIQNTTTPGTPIGIVYGTHRVGGHVINAYTEAINEVNSYLNAQFALSEGEIESISDVEINDRSFTAYQDISLFWRKGTKEQLPLTPISTQYNDGIDSYELASKFYLLRYSDYTEYDSIEIPAQTTHLEFNITADTRDYAARQRQITYVLQLKDINGVVLSDSIVTLYKSAKPVSIVARFPLYQAPVLPIVGSLSVSMPIKSITTAYNKEHIGYLIDLEGYFDVYLTKISIINTNIANVDYAPAMVHFNDIRNTQSINQLITPQTVATDGTLQGGAQYTTQTEVNKVYLNITAPALFSGGGTKGASVDFKIGYWRVGDTSTNPTYYQDLNNGGTTTFTLSHTTGTTSEKYRRVQVNLPELDYWRIVVWRETPVHDGDVLISDQISLGDVTESSPGGQIYPHTALLGVVVRATDQLSGSMPTITSLVKGVKVSVPTGYSGAERTWTSEWDGTLAEDKQWTDNPVWCMYDLITNKRYGFGDYFKISEEKKGLILHNFVEMANYCDVRLKDDGTVTEDLSDATARCRFSLNLVIDESKSAIEWLNTICACMRASLFYTEGAVYIDIDQAKNISQLFTMSSISEYTQSRSSRTEVPNTYEIQFLDKNNGYETTILSVEDPDFQADPTIEQRSKTIQFRGVTDEKQVRSLTKYALYSGKLARTFVSFKTFSQGLRTMVGDVIGVQHDVPRWGEAGRVISCTDEVDFYRLELADEITLVGGYSYQVCLARAGKDPEFADVISESGVSNFIDIAKTLTFVPEKNDEFIVGLTTNTVKAFRVLSLKRDTDEKVEVSAVEYTSALFPMCDNININSGSITYSPYESVEEPVRVSVSNVTVRATTYLDSSGVCKTGAIVQYTPPTDTYWKGVNVYYGLGSYSTMLPLNANGTVEVQEISEAGTYSFAVASVYADGTRQTVVEAPTTSINVRTLKPTVEDLALGVVKLTLAGLRDSATTFTGRDVYFEWGPPILAATLGFYTTDWYTAAWLSGYKVEILNTDLSLRRTVISAIPSFTYTYEMNKQDGAAPTRAIIIRVTAMTNSGELFLPSLLSVSNPAPSAL